MILRRLHPFVLFGPLAWAILATPACAAREDGADTNVGAADESPDAPALVRARDLADDPLHLANRDAQPVDWSVAIVESTMKRFTPEKLGGWGYQPGLYLWGQYLVYKRTHEPRYLAYIQQWVDRFVDASGHIDNSFSSLDSMQSGNLLLALFAETKQAKYSTAATQIRNRLKTYPRTTDNGFWHATSRQHQLWGDGTFMLVPFLARYGQRIGEASYANDESANQLLIYGSHLFAPDGLTFHAYDEAKAQSWANKTTGLSPEKWCRAVGWYGMANIETLEVLPANHPKRAALIANVQKLVGAYAKFQDPASGRWFQVVDKGNLSDNWTETSCSAMYTYVTSRAVQRGYVPPSFQSVADKGYNGVLERVTMGSDGLTNISEICIGTNVGDLAFYLGRPRAVNDLHGLGAVLIMNEQLAHPSSLAHLELDVNLDLDVHLDDNAK